MESVLSVGRIPINVNESHTFISKPEKMPQSFPRNSTLFFFKNEKSVWASLLFVVGQNGKIELKQNLATFKIKLSIC